MNGTFNQLDKQLAYISQNVPFYKGCSSEAIENFPIINKGKIRSDYQSFISDEYIAAVPTLIKIMQEGFPDDSMMELKVDDITVERTSGSSGFPFYVPKTLNERVTLGNILWNLRKKVLPDLDISKFKAINHTGGQVHEYSPYNFDIDNLIKFYEKINESKCECIHIQCPILLIHIDRLKNAGIKLCIPNLKYVESNGSFLSVEDEAIIKDYFNVRVINQYGMVETWPIGLAHEHNKFLLNSKSIYLEIIDLDGKPINEVNVIGKVVVTTLRTKLMPFIRYETGDYGYYPYPKKEIISLEQGREFSLIRGTSQLLFGIKEFKRILDNIRKMNISCPEHIQIFQETDDKFNIYISNIRDATLFLKELKKQTELLINKKIHLFWGIIEDADVWEIKHSNDKHHMFINKVIPGWVEKAHDNELSEYKINQEVKHD